MVDATSHWKWPKQCMFETFSGHFMCGSYLLLICLLAQKTLLKWYIKPFSSSQSYILADCLKQFQKQLCLDKCKFLHLVLLGASAMLGLGLHAIITLTHRCNNV